MLIQNRNNANSYRFYLLPGQTAHHSTAKSLQSPVQKTVQADLCQRACISVSVYACVCVCVGGVWCVPLSEPAANVNFGLSAQKELLNVLQKGWAFCLSRWPIPSIITDM